MTLETVRDFILGFFRISRPLDSRHLDASMDKCQMWRCGVSRIYHGSKHFSHRFREVV